MAGNRQQFTLQFNADTASAKRAIQDLQSSLDKLSKESLNSNYLDVGIKNAVKSAKELQIHLNKAFDQQTGKLNLNTFNASLKSAGQSASSLMQTLLQGGAAGQAAFTSLAGAIAQSEAPLKRTNALVKDFAQTLKNTVKWEISSTLVHGLEGALSGAVSYAKNLNTSLTNIRIVTGQSADDMARFTQQANKAAKELSTTTKAYADASLIYYQQGDNAEQAAKKAAITIKAANASFNTSAAEMSEYLTSVWNSYQVGANELERYVDIMAALGAKTATSLEEIATSMQKVAATSNTVGVSMEQVSSIIATVSSVTRESAESIGTSYKTIFARIGDLKLGETLEDGIGLGQVSSELSKIGIEILDASGNMRDMGTIIEELGAKWQTMSRAEQTAIAQVVAGKRQYTQLMALFENWDMYQNNMNIAQNADGSLQEMADIYAESWEAASARAQAAMEGLYSQLINDQAIIKLTNALTGITEAISSLIDGFGGLGGTISSLGGIAVAVFNKQIAAALNNTKTNVSTFMSQFQGQGFFKSVGTILSGKAKNNEQINWQKNQQEWQSSMQAIKANSSSEQVALANSKGLLSMKQQLIDAESRLTNAQKDRATALISQISMEQSTLLQLTQSYEEAAKALENFQKTSTKDVFRAAQTEAGKGGQRLSLNEAEAELDAYIDDDMVSKFGDYKPQDQTYKGVMSSYQSAVSDSVTASSGIQELESIQKSAMSAEQKLEQTRKTAEKLKNLFSDSVDASFLDDSKNDAAELIRQLQQVRTIADDVADEIDTAMGDVGSATGDKTAQAIAAQMDGIAQATEEAVKANFNRQGAADSVTSIGEELKNLFDAEATPAAKTFGSVMTKVAGVGMTMVGSFQSGASIVGAWADETATLGDHLSAAAGGISNLVSGFMSGGWIGLAISAITMVVSGIIEANKRAKEEYQKAQNERLEKITSEDDEKTAELNSNFSLIKSYNELYETYLTTGEGQESLKESAYALAAAYDAVGASLLAAEGNFTKFNEVIAQSIAQDFLDEINNYEVKIQGLQALLSDSDKKSQYRYDGDDEYTSHWDITWDSMDKSLWRPSTTGSSGHTPTMDAGFMPYMIHPHAVIAGDGGIDSNTRIRMENYNSQMMGYAINESGAGYYSASDFNLDWGFKHNKYITDYNDGKKGRKADYTKDSFTVDIDGLMTELYEIYGDYEVAGKRAIEILESYGIEVTDSLRAGLESWDSTTTLGKQTLEISGSTNEAEAKAIQNRLKQGQEDAYEFSQTIYDQYYGENGIFSELTDYISLDWFEYNEDEDAYEFKWNDLNMEDRWKQWNEMSARRDDLLKEIEENEARMADLDPNSYEYAILEERNRQLEEYNSTYFGILDNKEIGDAMASWTQYYEEIGKLNLAAANIHSLMGQSEATMDFSEFSNIYDNIIDTIESNPDLYQDTLKEFMDADGNIIDQAGYDNAIREIAMSLINDISSFDIYGFIIEQMHSMFSDKEYQAAMSLIGNQESQISGEAVTTDFLEAVQRVIDKVNRTYGETQATVAQYTEALNNDPIIQKYFEYSDILGDYTNKETNVQAVTSARDLIQSDMSAADGAQVYDLLWSEDSSYTGELIPWDDFIKLSYEQQQAYLDSIIEEDTQGLKDLAEQRATARRDLYNTWANEITAKLGENGIDTLEAERSNFTAWLEKNGYKVVNGKIIDSTGQDVDPSGYSFLSQEVSNAYSGDIFDMIDDLELGETLDTEADNAEAAARGWEMYGNSTESVVTKINRLKNALSSLPTKTEELKKLASELGVTMDKLINMDQIELAKEVIENLEAPDIADFTVDGEVNWGEYVAAQNAYEETKASASSILLQNSQNELNILLGQIDDLEKRTEKTKEKAEALESAILSGELTLAQQELFSETELAAWNNAANATERAAIAAKTWSQYSAETTTNAEKTAAIYTNAANNNFFGFQATEEGISKLTNGNDLFGAKGKENFENMLAEYETQGWFDPGEAAAWSTAYQSALSKGLLEGKTSNLEVIEVVRQELLSMADDATEEGKRAAAAAVDMIRSIFASIAEEEQAAADAAVNAWENAFTRIAELRKKILSGEDITGDIFGSGFDNLWQQFKDSGYADYASFSTDVKSGNYNPELPTFDLNEYMASVGIEQFAGLKGESDNFIYRQDMLDAYRADYIANGGDEQTADDWAYEQVQEDVRTALTNYNGVNGTNYDVDEVVAAYMNGDWTKQFDDGTGKMVTASQLFNMAADTMSDAGSQMSADMEWYTQRQEALVGAQSKAAEVLENGDATATVNGVQGDQEELTKLDAALERAQAEGAKEDANWENLSAEDRDLLASYGVTSFDEVDSAAAQCASALATLADVAYKAAETFIKSEEGGSYTQNEDGEWGTTDAEGNFQVDKEMTKYMQSLNEARDDSNHHVSDVNQRTTDYEYSGLASKAGFGSVAELKEYAEYLKELGEINGETEEDNLKLAASYARIQKGLKSVQANLKTYTKTLKEAQKGTVEHKKALDDMQEMYADVLDLDDKGMKALTEDFMTQEDVLKDLQDAADGVDGAYDRLQAKASKHILSQLTNGADISSMADEIDTLSTAVNSLPEGKAVDWNELLAGDEQHQAVAGALSGLSSFVAGLASNAAEAEGIMNALAAALGLTMEVQRKTFTIGVDVPEYTPGMTITDPATGTVYQTVNASYNKEEGTVEGFAIKAVTNKGSYGGGVTSPGGGGGGGGGGGKPKKLDKKKPEDHKKRYFQVDNALERMADALEKVDKIKRRAFGESYLKNLEAEISLIKQEIGLQEEYIRQAQEWLAVDKQRVASLGATFDGEGNISNYNALMDSILAKYNAFIDKYNAASASAQEDMEEEKEKMDEWFDEAMDWIDQYQETLNLIGDKQNEILELQNQISEKTLEKIQYKVEYKVEINEAEKDYLDYINDKYDEVLEKQDLLMDNYIRQGQIAEQNLSYLATARQELEAAFAAGDLNQADYVAGLQEIQSQILDNLEAIQEAKKAIEELYGKTLELASEELDKHTAKIDAASEAMGSYMSILQLMGKGQTFEDLLFFYEKQYDYNMASLESQMSYLNVLKEEEQYYLARMNSAEGLTETERIQYEALQETMNEVQANILSKTEETLQALKDMYDTTIEDIMKDLEESMVGVGNDLAWLTEEYGFYMEEMEQYVSSQRELYEISKLNRNIQQSINDTTSSVHKKQLKALQDEINAQSELKELSEYEIEMMNLKYELLLKQIALEEAQNAKSTVRLTRDSEGNMVYQYTADEDAINQAQQEYEDVLQQMADTNWEYEQDIYNQTLQLRQDTLEAIKEIAMDETLTEEQKQQRINEILDHYYERSRYLQEQYNIVSENTMATNELIADHYGIAVEEITDRTKGTVAEIIGEMINDTDNYRDEMETAYKRIRDAMEEYAQKIAEVTELTNTNYGSMIDSVETYDKVTEDAKNETAKMTKTLEEEVRQIHTTTTAWDNYYKKLGTVIDQYEAMYQAIQKTIKAQAQLAGATAPSSVNVNTNPTKPSTSGNSNTGNSNNNSGSGNGNGGSGGTPSTPKTGSLYLVYKAGTKTLATETKNNLSPSSINFATWIKSFTGYKFKSASPTTASIVAGKTTTITYSYEATGGSSSGGAGGGGPLLATAMKYASGGLADYTGPAWVDGSKSAPELVLNPHDTSNMLQTVNIVRQLDKSTLSMMDEFINLATSSMMANLFNIHAGTTSGAKDSEIEQNVHITAEFPNVQDSNEIQDAFDNLINRAAQYIGSKR